MTRRKSSSRRGRLGRLAKWRTRIRDAWHYAFETLLEKRGSPEFDKFFDALLVIDALRPDVLLLRRNRRKKGRAKILRRLWGMLAEVTLLEYKSPVDGSFERGDLLRLLAYGAVYHTIHVADLAGPADLTLALVLPAVTQVLTDELTMMGWTWVPLGGGYAKITGAPYTILVALVDEVCEAEKDEFLALFSRNRLPVGAAARWLQQFLTEAKMKRRKVKDMPGYDEMFLKLVQAMPLEQRLAGLDPKQRLTGLDPEQVLKAYEPERLLAGIEPEQRLAGLPPERALLAMPAEVLGVLPQDYVRSLPADVQREIKKRLRRAGQAASHRA